MLALIKYETPNGSRKTEWYRARDENECKDRALFHALKNNNVRLTIIDSGA